MKNCQKMYKALISYKIYINITLSTNIKFQFDLYINSIYQEKTNSVRYIFHKSLITSTVSKI